MRIILFLLSTFWCGQAFGFLDTLHVDTTGKTYRLNDLFQYYIDDSGTMSLQEIRALDNEVFTRLKGEDFRYKLTQAHIWMRLVLKGNLSQAEDFIIEFNDPSLYTVKLYEINNGTTTIQKTGSGVSPAEKAVKGNKNNFKVTVHPGRQQQLYFEVYSKTSITVSASMQAVDPVYVKYTNEGVIFGVYYGIIFILVLYGFLLFITTKYPVFIIYGIYITTIAGFTAVADGFLSNYLFSIVAITGGYHDILFFTATSLLGLVFMSSFLNISRWSNRLCRLIKIYAVLLIGLVVIFFYISKPLMLDIVQVLSIFTLSIHIGCGIAAVRRNIDQAKYYLLAYSAFGVFIIIFLLSQYRVIPFSNLVQYSIHIGYALSMIILSFGLSQRINSIYQALLNKEKEKKDLIEQKNRELEIKVLERTADIVEKEVNLRSILDNNDNAIWLVDKEYKLIDFNVFFADSWYKVYGTELKRGKRILDLLSVEDLKVRWKERYDRGLAGHSETYIDNYVVEESTHHYEIKGFPIKEGESIKGVAFFSNDITKRLKSEKQLKAQNKMLKKANKELDSFVYSASHDLKAPLASVLGLINLVKTENTLKTRLQYYELMEKSVVRLDRFIKDIIDYSRNERTTIKYHEVDLNELIENIFSDLKYLDGVDDIKKIIEIKGDRILKTDPLRLKVVIRNLVSNAIRYGCDTSQKVKQIDINAKINGDELQLTVRDYGHGISADHKEHIFEMFYRAHENSAGTGLGLYIVKETVAKLKGSISVKSEVGKGAEFIVTIRNQG